MLDFGLLLLGLLGLVIVLGVPYLLISHTRLKSRVAALEAEFARRETSPDTKTAPVTDERAKSADPWGSKKTQEPDQSKEPAQPAQRSSATTPAPDTPKDRNPSLTEPSGSSQDTQPQKPPRAFVFRQDTFDNLSNWLRENWVLAAGAASLALAGVFMVQYGAEKGLLTPFWRVMGALLFGSVLITGGEVIRRRFGDAAEGNMQHLPSALAGAGLITLFSDLLAARAMYGLIEPGTSLAALCLVSVLALVLGWFYGPFLSALGIIGATAAPFLVGGQSDAPWVFYYYFALIALVGLAIDTVKRWAWVSVLTLIASMTANWLLYLTDAGDQHFLITTLLIAGAAIVIPERSLWPQHGGSSFFDLLRISSDKRVLPEFTTRLSIAVTITAAAAGMMVVLEAPKPENSYLGVTALVILLIAAVIWLRRAPALFDHALVPGLAFLSVLIFEALHFGPLFREFTTGAERLPETSPPNTVWIMTAIGALGTILAFIRMRRAESLDTKGGDTPVFWALLAAVYVPAVVLILEFFWAPAQVVGAYPWALVSISVAALMALLAERTARGEDTNQRALRVALFAIAALSLISLAFFLLLAKTALTLALAMMVLLTVLIDRKFDLPVLSLFVQVGVAVITYRLVIDPGFPWATELSFDDETQTWGRTTPITQILLAYLGTLIPMGAAWFFTRATRSKTALILESAIATIGAVFVSVLIIRLISTYGDSTHADVGLVATVWVASMVNQLYRIQSSHRFTLILRGGLAAAYGIAALVLLHELFGDANPLINSNELVVGPPILDSLAAAYLLLGGVFAVAAWKVTHFGRPVQIVFAALASFLVAWYVSLEIRRLWRGNDLTVPGITDPELYSYTLALLVASAITLVVAFWTRSDALRKIAMAGVILTIAKVFLIDMSGLAGLTRVFSFMGLGLALLSLAWLNRVMTLQWNKGRSTDSSALEDDDG